MPDVENETKLPWHNPKFRAAHDWAYLKWLREQKAKKEAAGTKAKNRVALEANDD